MLDTFKTVAINATYFFTCNDKLILTQYGSLYIALVTTALKVSVMIYALFNEILRVVGVKHALPNLSALTRILGLGIWIAPSKDDTGSQCLFGSVTKAWCPPFLRSVNHVFTKAGACFLAGNGHITDRSAWSSLDRAGL